MFLPKRGVWDEDGDYRLGELRNQKSALKHHRQHLILLRFC